MTTPIRPDKSVPVTDAKGLPQRDWINYWADIATTASAGGASAANPTGTIGLTAVNGVATTFTRSDGAPALSQAINPTWTDLHIFNKGLRFSGPQTTASIIGADAFSTTNGINLTQPTMSGYAFGSNAARIWGNGDATFGYGNPSITSGALVREATLEALRKTAYTTYTGGSGVRSAFRATTIVGSGTQSYEWGILGAVQDNGGVGENVAVYGQMRKNVASSGTKWAMVAEMHAYSGSANPAGGEIGQEISMSGTGTDTGQKRIGLFISCFTDSGARYTCSDGIQFYSSDSNANLTYGIRFASSLSAVDTGYDTSFANVTGFAINMAGGQKIAFGNRAKNLYYDAGSVGLRYDTGSYSYVFHNNGTIDAAAFTVVSDRLFKRNIDPLTGGLALIHRLQPKWFEQQNGDEWKHHSGFIADELEDVLPDVVTTGPDGIKRVDYSRTPNAAVVSAIHELTARVAALEGRT